MELFYAKYADIPKVGGQIFLDESEAAHCMNVLRHNVGDMVTVIDGCGNLLTCRILEVLLGNDKKSSDRKNKKRVRGLENERVKLEIESIENDFGTHPYDLTMAVAPTKNMERYEWFVEKGVEVGLDRIVPVIGDHSLRQVLNMERLNKIVISAVKQSLKGCIPTIEDCISVTDFCKQSEADIKFICYCGSEFERLYICNRLHEYLSGQISTEKKPTIAVLIGPEGDFSKDEVETAVKCGFVPVHLGSSRLRTETAAVVATTLVASAF